MEKSNKKLCQNNDECPPAKHYNRNKQADIMQDSCEYRKKCRGDFLNGIITEPVLSIKDTKLITDWRLCDEKKTNPSISNTEPFARRDLNLMGTHAILICFERELNKMVDSAASGKLPTCKRKVRMKFRNNSNDRQKFIRFATSMPLHSINL